LFSILKNSITFFNTFSKYKKKNKLQKYVKNIIFKYFTKKFFNVIIFYKIKNNYGGFYEKKFIWNSTQWSIAYRKLFWCDKTVCGIAK